MQLFYQNGTLVTLASSARGNVRLLGHDRQCLAIHRSMAAHIELTAVDKMNTPTLQIVGQERSALAATVYGFIAASKDLPSGFNGECLDPKSGLYGLGRGYRWYSPVLRRFYSADAVSPFGRGGINSYAYAGGDPVDRLDPDGHVGEQYLWFKNLTPVKVYGGRDGFYSQSPNFPMQKKALYILGHGTAGEIELNGQVYAADGLKGHAMDVGVDFKEYRLINLLSCYSGTNVAQEGSSLAQNLANLTNLDVYGYDGGTRTVFAENDNSGLYAIGLLRAPYEGFEDIQRQTPEVDFVFTSTRFVPRFDLGRAGSSIRQA